MTSRSFLPLWSLALLLTPLGCETDAGEVAAKLQSCGLLTEGHSPELPIYAPNACYRRCFTDASCEELTAALCRTEVELLAECDRRCAVPCPGGGFISDEQVCNGSEECSDGSDEVGCPEYECADSQRVVGGERCDGTYQCADGSDERDCPLLECTGSYPDEGCPSFLCEDGQAVMPSARCNGWAQCADESDEDGCATVVWEVCSAG